MKKVLSKIGGHANSNSSATEEGAAGEHDPPSAAAATRSTRRFSMNRFSLNSVQLPTKFGAPVSCGCGVEKHQHA